MEFYIPFFIKSLLASISAVSVHQYINYIKIGIQIIKETQKSIVFEFRTLHYGCI